MRVPRVIAAKWRNRHAKTRTGRLITGAITPAAQGALNLNRTAIADGSGKIRALNRKNREVTLDFAVGEGPRTIRYTPPYSVCVWSLIPVNTPAKSVTNRN